MYLTMRARLIFAALVVTAASVAANQLYPVAPPSVCDPPTWTQRDLDCGPGPRVLVVGGSVALGWGASDLEHTWWALACRQLGGTWHNAGEPAQDAGRALRQMEENRSHDYERVLAVVGANDLVYGLAPGVQGQFDARLARFLPRSAALRDAGATVVLQPIPLGAEGFEVTGHEDEVRAAYAAMAAFADVNLSDANVDYVDLVHFGDRGHAIVARAIVEALR